jgi:hypothetical protein
MRHMPLPLFVAAVHLRTAPNQTSQRGLVNQVPLLVEFCWRNEFVSDQLQAVHYSGNTPPLTGAERQAGKAKECFR